MGCPYNSGQNQEKEDAVIYTFCVEKTLDAPLAKVWAVVADFGNLDWFAGAERVEQVGEGVGQVRRIYMPGSEYPVDEKLLALDENSHSFEYQVLEGDVNIMQDYRVAASLEAIDGGTRARWNCSFSGVSVEGVEPESMIGIMQEMYGGMLEAIAAEANRR